MVDVVPFSRAFQDVVIDLILAIQQVEFGFDIRAEDQPDLQAIEDFYQTGAGGFWVALVEGRPVGTIGLRDIGERQGALRKMFVKPAYRGKEKAVAETLLQTLLESARAGGIAEVFLDTTEKLVAAHSFAASQSVDQVPADR